MVSKTQQAPAMRQYEVIKKSIDSDEIASFYLKPTSGSVPSFTPGDYLVFETPSPLSTKPEKREYSISHGTDDWLRVTIKLEGAPKGLDVPPGLASTFFHEKVEPGKKIMAYGPSGSFKLKETERPVVLLSGGVGQTPLIAMAHHIAEQASRPTVFIHACQNGSVHALNDEIKVLQKKYSGLSSFVFYAEPSPSEELGVDYDYEGFVDRETLEKLCPQGATEYYLCGPGPFMKAMYDILKDMNVDDSLISYEFFGPATLLKQPKPQTQSQSQVSPDANRPTIKFQKSGVTAAWGDPDIGNLLELAEENGVLADYSCRAGTCDTCKTKIIAGKFAYKVPPMEPIEDGFALLCCAKPTENMIIDL